MDYPSLSSGSNFLYVNVNVVGVGVLYVRAPLAELRDRTTLHMSYAIFAKGNFVAQHTGPEAYWAHHETSSKIRVYSWHESASQILWRDIPIGSWPTGSFSSLAPDGANWIGGENTFPGIIRGAVLTGRIAGPELWLAWTSPAGGGFPEPHIQVVLIDPTNFTLVRQSQIWNPEIAFGYAALAQNLNAEVGISLAWGGGRKYHESHAVGFLGDGVLYNTGLSNASRNRWGDYVTIRQHHPDAALFSAEGYSTRLVNPHGQSCSMSPCRFEPRYVLFGRATNTPPPR
jgi:hypothetical protein